MSLNKKQLHAYPVIEDLEYRQKISSNQLNKMFNSIEESILRTIIRSNEVQQYYEALNLGVVSSYNSLSLHQQSFTKYPSTSGAFATSYDEVSGNARQNIVAGITTLDWDNDKKFSKIPRVNGEVASTVSIYVNGSKRNEEDSTYNMLNRDFSSLWIEQASPGLHDIELRLPPSINRRFNYLELVPFPVMGLPITKITYQDNKSIDRTIFDSSNNQYPFYNNKGPMIFHLQPREYNGTIKIYFDVLSGIDVMGFSSIDIGLIDYVNTKNTFWIPFKNINNAGTITPTEIELDFHIDGTWEEGYDQFFKDGGISIVNSVGDSISLKITKAIQNNSIALDATNGLWLKCVMREVDMTTPIIRGCKFNY